MQPKIKALIEQIESGQLKSNMSRIGHFIMTRGGSDIETMRSILNIKHQSLTGSMSIMEDNGLIFKSGTCKDGRFTQWMWEPSDMMRMMRIHDVKQRKFELLCKRLYSDFSDMMSNTMIDEIDKILN